MYNLIVGVIAGIVLGTLSIAGVWYGGAVYEQARLRAELVAVQGQQQQIAAALDLRETEGGRASSIGEDGAALTGLVVDGFLKEVPPGTWRVRRAGDQVWSPIHIQTPKACATMNRLSRLPEICPPCESETLKKFPACELPEGAV